MKNIWIIAGLIVLIAFFIMKNKGVASPESKNVVITPTIAASKPTLVPVTVTPAAFGPPVNKAADRVTKKKFGTYITPQNSPVKPEKFTGFHVGTDFEIFPEEATTDVTVHAVCTGKLILKESASGYGGVIVQSCMNKTEPITIIYGHLKLASVTKSVGDAVTIGENLGVLGLGFSPETDGERKHLHLGIHKGETVSIRGYVATEPELSDWIDPCLTYCE